MDGLGGNIGKSPLESLGQLFMADELWKGVVQFSDLRQNGVALLLVNLAVN